MPVPPKISVICPAYNEENYIETFLNCFLNQTYQNFEVVICLNACTDKTLKVIEGFRERV